MFFIVLTVLVFVFACSEGKPSEAEAHIIGGEPAYIKDYPYQVSVQRLGKHRCGGSIISQTSILTAARCFDGHNRPVNIAIRAGSSIYNSGGVLVYVNDIIQHSSYDFATGDYDIAILNLRARLTYGSEIQPIGLARSRPVDGTFVFTSGWGHLQYPEGMELSQYLYAAYLYTINQEDCQSAYDRLDITIHMLCAYRDNAGSCSGDSGGPLAVRTYTNYTLIGIVSWGYECILPGYPGVYTDVSTLWDWIQDNMIPD